MARLKARLGVETLEIPIIQRGTRNEIVYVIESPSIEAFRAYSDLLDLGRQQNLDEQFGKDAPDLGIELDVVNARLQAYIETIPEGETIESMLVGPDVWRRLQEDGHDEFCRQRVANTVMVWTATKSTDKAGEFWMNDGADYDPKAHRPKARDYQKKSGKRRK